MPQHGNSKWKSRSSEGVDENYLYISFVGIIARVVGGRGRGRRVGRDGRRRGVGGLSGLFLVVQGRRVVVAQRGW